MRIHIDLSFLVKLFRIKKFFKSDVNDRDNFKKIDLIKNEEQTLVKSTRLDWLESVTVNEIVKNVRTTINACGFYADYGDKLKIGINELSMEIALGLDGESYTKKDIEHAFDEGIGTTTGIIVVDDMIKALAEYYYTKFYSDEKQKEYYEIGQAKRNEN